MMHCFLCTFDIKTYNIIQLLQMLNAIGLYNNNLLTSIHL